MRLRFDLQPMFSRRVPSSLAPNALTVAVARARDAGGELLDLTVSNPTVVGIDYPASLLAALGDPRGLTYRPEPLGLPEARDAVALEHARRGLDVPADRVLLTASTSEAYGLLFKLLCEPGDAVLVPRPSYPLFEHLAAFEAVRLVPYPLEYHGAWTVDLANIERLWNPRSKAVIVVSPNNPTGSLLRRHERHWLDAFCARREAAVIADEVFADYLLEPSPDAAPSVLRAQGSNHEPAALTFALGGLSKSLGLPQLKLGWVATDGPGSVVEAALGRLELICDTYLSVSSPVQVALPRLFGDAPVVREAIRARVSANHATLRRLAARHPETTLLRTEGGWAAVLRVPQVVPEETLVLDLLEGARVLVHPGYFFDFPHEAYLVVSLLPPPSVFEEGIARVLGVVALAERAQ